MRGGAVDSRTKKEEKERRIRDIHSGAAKKIREKNWVGHVFARGRNGLMTPPLTFQNLLTTPP